MKFVYIDESGKDDAQFAVLCGVAFDHHRMKKTKLAWIKFIKWLNTKGVPVSELHASEFFAGKGVWYKKFDASKRKELITYIIKWLGLRSHEFCVVAVDKEKFSEAKKNSKHVVYTNLWFFLSTHLLFAFSKRYQGEHGVKGDFVAVFDEGCVGGEFNKFIISDMAKDLFKEYLGKKGDIKLSDVPFSANSKFSSLIQIADFVTFFVRRKNELENGSKEKYIGEKVDIDRFYKELVKSRIEQRFVYKKTQRSIVENLFYDLAPEFIRQ